MPTLHTLLVGINEYASPEVRNLQGCVNDVENIDALLAQYANSNGFAYNSLIRANKEAMRATIMSDFNAHLGQAKAGDSVLFYFSGHGSQEPLKGEEFKKFFPEGKFESILCHDSRTENEDGKYIFDLADKELAYLLSGLSQGVHATVILDSCHSGSGTRTTAADQLLEGFLHQEATSRNVPPSSVARGITEFEGSFITADGQVTIPMFNHILLAACRPFELAQESSQGGYFSMALQKALKLHGATTYYDLFQSVYQGIKTQGHQQHPQFEPVGNFNTNDGFLNLSQAREATRYPINFNGSQWKLNIGALHGLPIEPGHKTSLAIIDKESLQIVAYAKTTKVSMHDSYASITEGQVDKSKSYLASITNIPLAPFYVCLRGNENTLNQLREAVASKNIEYIRFQTESDSLTQVILEASENSIKVLRPETEVFMEENFDNNTTSFFKVDQKTYESYVTVPSPIRSPYNWLTWTLYGIEHIYRWHRLASPSTWDNLKQLNNSSARVVPENQMKIQPVYTSEELQGVIEDKIHITNHVQDFVELRVEDGEKGLVSFIIQNDFTRPLYLYLFYLQPDFGIQNICLPQPQITSGSKLELTNGFMSFFVPKGQYETLDRFLLIASDEEQSNLSSLAQKDFVHRDFGGVESQEKTGYWQARILEVHTIKQLDTINDKQSLSINNAIEILPHSQLTAKAGVTSSQVRNLGAPSAGVSVAQVAGLQPVAIAKSRSQNDDILELGNIAGEDSLSENPLKLLINTKQLGVEEGEILLPLVFDGEDLLPAGVIDWAEDGRMSLDIRHIPETEEGSSRSLGKALRLTFYKISQLNQGELQQLRWYNPNTVTDDPRGEGLSYSELQSIKEGKSSASDGGRFLKGRVAESQKVLLVVHGIIGDTQDAVRALYPTASDKYDLILTFDYENLNTPIGDTAQKLKEMLTYIGLGKEDETSFTIIAHSMGGLVSRYMIEQLGGHEFVDKLIMAGTPNAGSALASPLEYRKYALIALSLIIKLQIPYQSTLKFIKNILSHSEKLTVTLEQMKVDGDFLKQLNSHQSTGNTQYYTIAGNIWDERTPNSKLLDKLFTLVGWVAYGKEIPNDIAVSVDSIKAIASDSVELPCNHIGYFYGEGLEKVAKYL